ncbi:acyltransferase family protein [Ilumatobacter sp.]|uniref:acyltransferase family protein n=1 Tax=Ilumatobacter sp. TaxID=1967498 RepID=UPI003751C608
MSERALPSCSEPLSYQPALDGLRAVAVAMVMCFHAGFGWMGGGYFGVSIFFTLSGFLITTLLIDERERTGALALGSFIARRAKRLLPASMACIALVSVARLMGQFDQVPGLRSQLLGATTHVFNWVKLDGDTSYTDVFTGSAVFVSPLEHYWSLAIEEQFYLLWPLTVALLARRVTRWSITLPVLFLAAAIATPIAARFLSDNATYWATPMRAGELLAGAAVAGVLRRWGVPAWAGLLALPVAAALATLAVVLPTASGPAYAGLFAPLAALSAVMLWSLQVAGPVRRALSSRPLVQLGQISYGVYLFHWPVFVWLRQQGWSLTEPWRFVIALAATLAIAAASFVLIERPVRSASWPVRSTIRGAAGAMLVAGLTVAVLPFSRGFLEADPAILASASAEPLDSLAPLQPTAPVTLPDFASVELADFGAQIPIQAIVIADTAEMLGSAIDVAPAVVAKPFVLDEPLGPPLSRPVRLLTVGDSTAFYLGQALAEWALDHREYATSDLLWCQGCGVLRGGEVTSWDDTLLAVRSREMFDVDLPSMVARIQPDVVALMVTVVDVADRQWAVSEGPLEPTDARYVARLAARYRSTALDLLDLGVGRVALIAPPPAVDFVAHSVAFTAERWVGLRAALDLVALELAPEVAVVDLAGWADAAGVTNDLDWRPDGTHLTERSARAVVERWLGPILIGHAV